MSYGDPQGDFVSSNSVWIPNDGVFHPTIITTTSGTTGPDGMPWYQPVFPVENPPQPSLDQVSIGALLEMLNRHQHNTPPPIITVTVAPEPEEEAGPPPVKKYGRVLEP